VLQSGRLGSTAKTSDFCWAFQPEHATAFEAAPYAEENGADAPLDSLVEQLSRNLDGESLMTSHAIAHHLSWDRRERRNRRRSTRHGDPTTPGTRGRSFYHRRPCGVRDRPLRPQGRRQGPASTALVREAFPDPGRSARALGVWAVGGAVAGLVGQPLGGL
jgi:hypothetical protein